MSPRLSCENIDRCLLSLLLAVGGKTFAVTGALMAKCKGKASGNDGKYEQISDGKTDPCTKIFCRKPSAH